MGVRAGAAVHACRLTYLFAHCPPFCCSHGGRVVRARLAHARVEFGCGVTGGWRCCTRAPQVSQTAFSAKGIQKRGDTSMWTDTPASIAARNAQGGNTLQQGAMGPLMLTAGARARAHTTACGVCTMGAVARVPVHVPCVWVGVRRRAQQACKRGPLACAHVCVRAGSGAGRGGGGLSSADAQIMDAFNSQVRAALHVQHAASLGGHGPHSSTALRPLPSSCCSACGACVLAARRASCCLLLPPNRRASGPSWKSTCIRKRRAASPRRPRCGWWGGRRVWQACLAAASICRNW